LERLMPSYRRSPESAFLMTPEQYLARAASLRASGNEVLAQQYDNLYRLRTLSQKKEAAELPPDGPYSIVPRD
jgi:hypothetical protein